MLLKSSVTCASQKTNVIGYATFFESSGQQFLEQLRCFSMYFSHIFIKGRQLPSKKNTCSRSARQEQCKSCEICIKVTVKRMSDTGASSLDIILVSLLLTFNIGIVCRFVVSWHFCQFCSAGIYLFKFNKKNIRTLNVESVQS